MSAGPGKIFIRLSGYLGAAIILLYLAIAIAADLGLTPHDPLQQSGTAAPQGPSLTYWMGTDIIGRDLFSRLMIGIEQSLIIAFGAIGLAAGIGVLLGLTCFGFGRLWTWIITGAIKLLLILPAFFLALLFIAGIGPGTLPSVFAIGLALAPHFALVMHRQILTVRDQGYFEVSRGFGSSFFYRFRHHLVPSLILPLTSEIFLSLASAMLLQAALGFLGLSTPPAVPSLGSLMMESARIMGTAPWLLVFPALAITLAVLGFNLLGRTMRSMIATNGRGIAT